MPLPILTLPDCANNDNHTPTSSVLTVSNRLRVVPSNQLRSDAIGVFEILSSVGEIQQIDFTNIQEDGSILVTYFDMRCARRALMELSSDFKQLMPDMSYDSLGSRSVRISRDPSISLDDTMNALGKFGEIERISFADSDQLLIEFFDTRGPLAVMRALSMSVSAKPAIGGEARRANYSNPPVLLEVPSPPAIQKDLPEDFEVDIERINSGQDTRTTLMIRNIPNKYAQKNLLKLLDLQFKDKYDFFYLPIDYKNKCNVGYAFMNFGSNHYKEGIVSLFKIFDEKKWEKFNSEKICKISYARLQGQDALLDHFKSSSVMQQHKQLRPFFTGTTTPSVVSLPNEVDWCGGSDISGMTTGSTSAPGIVPPLANLNNNTVEGSIYIAVHAAMDQHMESSHL